jgi:spermidine synthase
MTRARSSEPRAATPPARSAVRGPRTPGGAMVPGWAALCFVASGTAGLLYEVVWSKQLAYLLGSSLHSVAVVVAAFLGGLALGAHLLGGRLSRSGDPGRRYAQLEFAVGIVGLLVLPLLRALDPVVGVLYRALGGEGAAFAAARVALSFLVLVPPAALMGATLPVLVARVERGRLGAGLAGLYALNTAGAVLGSLLGGFVLLPAWGLLGTTGVAAALNAGAGLLAWRVARPQAAEPLGQEVAGSDVAALPPRARAVLGVVFACSGFAALVLQIAWVRLYGLVLGSTVYAFSAVLGVYLAGIAVGSAVAGPFLSRVRSAGPLAIALLGLALASLLGVQAYPTLPAAMLRAGQQAGDSWLRLWVAQWGLVLPVLGPPCLLLGAIFPLATRLLQSEEGGPAAGRAYALNTVGTIAGSLLAGFLLLPRFGVQGSVLTACAFATAAGIAVLALPGAPRPTPRALGAAAVLLVATGVAAALAPRWDAMLMSLGTYRPFHARNLMASFRAAGGLGDPTRAVASAQRVLFYEEGVNASVLVATDQGGVRRWLRIGGKIDAGTGDMTTQVLLGLLPAAMAEPGASTLIVGHGSGATAAAALAAGVGRTEIVELEPAVIAASRLFHAPGEDPLDDPRVTVRLEDARTRLLHGAGRYGLVISEPTNPWIAGVNSLFTVDFYRRVRARLEPDGVFAQWIQAYELSPETFQVLVASFRTVFPEADVFCVWGANDVVLIAAPAGRTLQLERLRSPQVQRQVLLARLDDAWQLAGFYAGRLASLPGNGRTAVLDTDDRPIVEYRAPRDLVRYGGGSVDLAALIGPRARAVAVPQDGALAGWPADTLLRVRAEARLAGADDDEANRVYLELRDAGALALARELAVGRSERIRAARRDALAEEARAWMRAGRTTEALPLLEQLTADPASPPDLWTLLAEARRRQGDAAGAGRAAERALAQGVTGSARLEAELLAGSAAAAQGRRGRALQAFREAQRLSPADARGYDLEARIHAQAGDWARAREVVARGLRASPDDPVLRQAAAALDQQARRRR